jgi:hypothetical protein
MEPNKLSCLHEQKELVTKFTKFERKISYLERSLTALSNFAGNLQAELTKTNRQLERQSEALWNIRKIVHQNRSNLSNIKGENE